MPKASIMRYVHTYFKVNRKQLQWLSTITLFINPQISIICMHYDLNLWIMNKTFRDPSMPNMERPCISHCPEAWHTSSHRRDCLSYNTCVASSGDINCITPKSTQSCVCVATEWPRWWWKREHALKQIMIAFQGSQHCSFTVKWTSLIEHKTANLFTF